MEQQLQELDLDQKITSDHQPTATQQNQQQSREQGREQSQQKQHQQRTIAIIDGPSLAYHVCVQYREENAANPSVELRPSYSEIGIRAVKFLEDMEVVGLQIHAVYFDGVLPFTKLGTRKQRLEKTMTLLGEAKTVLWKQPFRMLQPKKKLPEPPFMVPSVLEAIKASKFGGLVTVVPGEADDFCADEAAAYESRTGKMATIITNDSDLLIQVSGTETRVMLLGSITRSRVPDPIRIRVEANVFFPAKLAAAAGVNSLVSTAFLMREDRYLSFDAAVAKAKKASKETTLDSNPEFLAFQMELQKPAYDTSGFSESVTKALQEMDPRIAELAHQIMPGHSHDKNQPANIFLVPLHEDVGRFSAWISGKDIRNATYRMILDDSRSVPHIEEYTRRGTVCHSKSNARSFGWMKEMLNYTKMLSAARDFLEPYGATAAQRFNYTAMYYAITAWATRKKKHLSQEQVSRVLAKEQLRSWEELHASAMCQAAIYSLRMLKQLLALEKAKGSMDLRLAPLDNLLGEMPTLAELLEKSEVDTVEFWDELSGGLVDTVVDE